MTSKFERLTRCSVDPDDLRGSVSIVLYLSKVIVEFPHRDIQILMNDDLKSRMRASYEFQSQ